MSPRHLFCATSVLAVMLVAPPASGQSVEGPLPLVISAGRSLRIALDRRVTVKQVGQPVSGTLVEPVYAYDRIVLPAGTKAIGHVQSIDSMPRGVRVRAILAGDFTPPRRAVLQFDSLILADGRSIPIETSASEGTENVVLRMADAPETTSMASRARKQIAAGAKQTAAVVTAPGKAERLKVAAIRALPYHPLLLAKGTVYAARLVSPIEYGSAVRTRLASADAKPAPESILRAQLVTPMGSATSTAGSKIEAVLTEPVFAADGSLILPEGARLTGQVTLSKPARRFHRHGQLRFLFERVQAFDRAPEPLLAALHAVESGQRDRLRIDEEGGATSSSPTARFVAPALAALALVGATHGRLDYDTDGLGPEMAYGGAASGTLGGFLGLGLVGIGANQLGRYVTVATTAVGLARTVYSTVFGKGRNISFPRDTAIQVQLAPKPAASRPKQERQQ